MSTVYLPDPHPGRCLNHRGDRRCLDYEDVEHVCTFDPPPAPMPVKMNSTFRSPEPVSWVKP